MPTVERSRTHRALASASRVRLLDAVRRSDGPLDARELAQACGLHVSTVRFHLGVLHEAGLVRSRSDAGGTRGRPRLRYTAAGAGSAAVAELEHTGYRLLAAVLAEHWGTSANEPARRAERAGRALAGRQGFPALASARPTVADAAAQLNGLFTELGFEPELAADGEDHQIRLHACPFRAVAQQYPEVVCSLHLGWIRGALDRLGAAAIASDLRPFVEPHLCVASLAPAAGS
ncbi:MAG: helix-turn-helix domain-containing protein [Actinobacteria bacterium]|nr:helix-turn-helix domain-containing protein [Actinomycetota bacterium]